MRHLVESKRILLLIGTVILVGGCVSMASDRMGIDPGPEKTASTMTQSPDDYRPERSAQRAEQARVRAATAEEREAARAARAGAYGGTIQGVPARPMSRAERALAVLRRSPLGAVGRFIGRPFGLGQTTTATAPPAVATDTTGMAVTDTTPRTIGTTPQISTGGTTLPGGPQANPGAGRVIVGQPQDTGSGIRSTVTGTPVEPVPGGTASTNFPSTTNTQTNAGGANSTAALNADTAGRASAASSATGGTTGTTATPPPPLDSMATSQPPSGTAVTNTGAAGSEVEVKTNPDGTPVITNEDAQTTQTAPPPKKRTTRKTRRSGS